MLVLVLSGLLTLELVNSLWHLIGAPLENWKLVRSTVHVNWWFIRSPLVRHHDSNPHRQSEL